MSSDDKIDVAVIGAGPAGLTAAYELQRLSLDRRPTVFEAGEIVGGIARTENYKGFRFDIGGHRFFTKVPEVEAMWREVLKDDLVRVRRLSRIYYRGKYYDYPLKLLNALGNIGPYESMRILASYLKWRLRPHRSEESFEKWVINRFGGRLYMHFFRSYTQKVWGIAPSRIQADWAAQRIKNLSLSKAVWNAISGSNDTTSLIEKFDYPRLGPGMMWERTADQVKSRGGRVHLRVRVERLIRDGNRITAVETRDSAGRITRHEPEQVISTMSLRDLIGSIDPAPPESVVRAASRLKYRDFLIVALVLDRPDPFPDNWIYVHSPQVSVGRIQNFRAWSRDMVPNERQASIGMEYFCQRGDALWNTDDAALVRKATMELEQLGLARPHDVVDGTVIRQAEAYPVYDAEYRRSLDVISEWIRGMVNLQTVGRNGLHRYNNQDHSMLTAMFAARNVLGASHDVWSVNVDRAYHEEFQREEREPTRSVAAE